MSAKKAAAWKTLLLSLLVTMLVYGGGILLIALLTVRGTVGEERTLPLLAALALLSTLLGGMAAGKERLGAKGSLINSLLFGGILASAGLGHWQEITASGLILLGMLLTGGVLAALICGKVGKRPGKRLVKTHKKARCA